jgi:putative hydrolase of HD superfamily
MSGETSVEVGRILDFAIELDRLKAVLRRTRPIGLERYENSAEHSWQLAIVAMVLAPRSAEPVDLQRVLELLLVHDVPEIEVGDHFVYSRDPAATALLEAEAAERIFGLLPPEEGRRLHERWREFEDQATPEARFARALDRLLPVLQNLRGGARSWRENGVSAAQVKAVNGAIIACALPSVWAEIEPGIDALFASGDLGDDAASGPTPAGGAPTS